MKKEEAIEIIKSECYVFNPLNFDGSTMINTALDMAIKALEQESVLDKINAEIQKLRGCSDGIIDDVEDIIDKYKEEMEEEE
jgi:hypothetical protein